MKNHIEIICFIASYQKTIFKIRNARPKIDPQTIGLLYTGTCSIDGNGVNP